jgi:hypothetical protein
MIEEEFKVSDKSKAKIAGMKNPLISADDIIDFFDLWETEDDPRKAGSIMANFFLRAAAKFAVFGAFCAGREPSRELWLGTCNSVFDQVVKDCIAVLGDEPTLDR